MPMLNVTDSILNEEVKEMEKILNKNAKAKEAFTEFEAECKLRRQLVAARKEKAMTQTELKEQTGLTQQMISRIEKDYEISPSLKNLIKYVNAIGYELTLQPKQK